MNQPISRRCLLKRSAIAITSVAAGGVLLPVLARADSGESLFPPPPTSSKRVLRFAHPTDIHVQPELHGGEGMAAAFKHMMSLKDPPQMILTGGDLPYDTASTEHARSDMLWKLFQKVLGDTVPASMPIHHTIGNHDVWGRDIQACGATGDEPFYGKRWFLDIFGYQRTYYSFDQAGWHFVVLDSLDLVPKSKDFVARIVGEQLDWLKADLAATPTTTPIIIVTHVPIISTANFFDQETGEQTDVGADGDITVSHRRMHVDYRALDALFTKHPNIKLCLSGHLHQLNRTEYNNITHICDGAVCADKWKGPRLHTSEGYGLIDLYADGSFEHRYLTFGWKAST